MVLDARRKRLPEKGLLPGERLKRDKLAGAEIYSQWGWVSRISDPSLITPEHLFAACGFNDRSGKPICRNKYSESGTRRPEEGRADAAQDAGSSPEAGGDDAKVVIVTSDDEGPPVCNRKRCKENPQCLNYLGQVKLENQDTALKSFLELSHLGRNPLSNAREPDLPVGLKNLGATCYANAFIQERPLGYSTVWFQDHAFRDGVYRCQPSQEEGIDLEESPIFQLQVTFAALQESTQNVFNPIKLVESLQLRTSEQQDAQEFSKLFMSHLSIEFEKQEVPALKTLLADQFEGKLTYGTMCQKCRHRSERDMDFLELEINLETNAKLEERVEALLQSEELTDDNKYYCTRCDSLQNAIRYTKLRRLPPVLHFSVLRFVFDIATLSRKKSKQAILFPSVLDMSPFVDAAASGDSGSLQPPAKRRHIEAKKVDDASDLIYELRGVLLHKGPSAYHGHYEAQVFDVTTRQFYQFNDETVTPITSLQSKKSFSIGDKGAVDEKRSSTVNKNRRTYSRKRRRIDDSDCETQNNGVKIDPTSSYTSSKDAYMLIYARRQPGSSGVGSSPEPPPEARERVAQLNKSHGIACASYTERETQLTTTFRFLQQKKINIYHHWHIHDFREESAVISRGALEDWLTKDVAFLRNNEPPNDSGDHLKLTYSSGHPLAAANTTIQGLESTISPLLPFASTSALQCHRLDNSSIICSHGALDPLKAGDMKRINKEILAVIRCDTNCYFDPVVTTKDICQCCVRDIFLEKRYMLDHSSQVACFDELCRSEIDDDGAWISKPWLRDWRQDKPKMHIAGTADPAPDSPKYVSHVQCSHGQLALASSSRQWINAKAFTFLQSLFPTWRPIVARIDDPRTSCAACDEELSLSKGAKQELKQRVEREKEKLRNIVSSNILAMDPSEITPGVTQAIVPAAFLRQWRAWINRPQDKPRPGAIDNNWLICRHGRLVVDPSVPQDLGTSVSLVSLADWETLKELYGGGPLISLTGHASHSQEPQGILNLTHDYEVCHECRSERLSNFETATISIRILRGELESRESSKNDDTLPGSSRLHNAMSDPPLNHASHNSKPLRTSRRLRNSKQIAGHVAIRKLSTIMDIKIQLQKELDIPTIYQRLFFKGKELINNSETVASLGVVANDILDLREEKEDEDALDLNTETEPPEEGRAFGGTILSGASKAADTSKNPNRFSPSQEKISTSNHCPVCTFINSDDLTFCSMCGSRIRG